MTHDKIGSEKDGNFIKKVLVDGKEYNVSFKRDGRGIIAKDAKTMETFVEITGLMEKNGIYFILKAKTNGNALQIFNQLAGSSSQSGEILRSKKIIEAVYNASTETIVTVPKNIINDPVLYPLKKQGVKFIAMPQDHANLNEISYNILHNITDKKNGRQVPCTDIGLYTINFIIDKDKFTRALCSKILYSLLAAHKKEIHTNNVKQLVENEIDALYSGRNGEGVGVPPFSYQTSISKIIDAKNNTFESYGLKIPASKVVIRVGMTNDEWLCEDNGQIGEKACIGLNNLIRDAIIVYNVICPEIGITVLGINSFVVTAIPTKSENITWLTFFGSQLVNKFGREKLLSAPAYKIVELSGGGILLISGPAPYDTDKSKYFENWFNLKCQQKIAKHLGLNVGGEEV